MKTSHEEKLKYITADCPIKDALLSLNPHFILDVGACDGLDSIIYSRLLPSATIYAIEARRDNYQELVANMQEFACKNVIPGNFCLSDQPGVVKFYVSFGQSGRDGWDTGNKSSSLFKPLDHLKEHPWCEFAEEQIQAVRFDALGIKQVDFVHLDVQGAELKVLQSMGAVFDMVKMIWCEVSTVKLYDGQPLKHDIEAYLCYHKFGKAKDTSRRFGDQLWIR